MFGHLNDRWRSLIIGNDTDGGFMSTTVSACCILHNVCEVHGDDFDDNWSCEDETSADVVNATVTTSVSATAEMMITALRDYFDQTQ